MTPAVVRIGRPTKIDQILYTDDDGTQITVGQHFLNRLALGAEIGVARTEAGISKQTLSNWRNRAATARDNESQGIPIPPSESPFVDFLDRFEAAEAAWHLEHLARIERASRDSQTVTKTTVKTALNADGETVEIERTTTIEERPPLWTASAWRLERRYPGLYGRRMDVTVGPGSGTGEDRAAGLADEVDAYLLGQDDAAERLAIDVESVEG